LPEHLLANHAASQHHQFDVIAREGGRSSASSQIAIFLQLDAPLSRGMTMADAARPE
jgi:hypothetical protein